jgi:hypothetical protein
MVRVVPSVRKKHQLLPMSQAASKLRALKRIEASFETHKEREQQSGETMSAPEQAEPFTMSYTSEVVRLIQAALPGERIALDPTMGELARYGRLAGVNPAQWLEGRPTRFGGVPNISRLTVDTAGYAAQCADGHLPFTAEVPAEGLILDARPV